MNRTTLASVLLLGLSLPLGGAVVRQVEAPTEAVPVPPVTAVDVPAPVEDAGAAAPATARPAPSEPAGETTVAIPAEDGAAAIPQPSPVPEAEGEGDMEQAVLPGDAAAPAETVAETAAPPAAPEAPAPAEDAGLAGPTTVEGAATGEPVGESGGAAAAAYGAAGGERAELLELKHTITNLVDALVAQGVLSADQAESIVKQAESKAAEQAAAEMQAAAETRAVAAASTAAGEDAQAAVERQEALAGSAAEEGVSTNVVRVPYVPEFVIEDIRNQVRSELRADVTQDVLQQAKNERWGVPEALPDWIDRIKLSGDIRLRGQTDRFADKNQPFSYPDFNAINDAGGVVEAGRDAFLNTTEDRTRGRLRARLGLKAKVTNNWETGFRLVLGNERDPVSTNQTLGNYGGKYDLNIDLAYLKYTSLSDDGYPWMVLSGGRIENPWYHTDLVWDSDLTFEGMAVTFRRNLKGSDSLFAMEDRSDTAYLTLGAFPIQEVELSSHDKWLFGAQLGTELVFENQSALQAGLAYYSYQNIAGQRNEFLSTRYDWTAPEFVQKGNTMFDIRNDPDPTNDLFALAADYELVNLTASYDFAQLAPIHVILTGDYVRNIGFDQNEIERRTGARVDERTDGWQLGLSVGWPKVDRRGNWRVFGAYKYLQRDAVLDAFTDSDFHLGGTDGKGFVLGGDYGLADNTWLRLRWLSSNEIDGPPLGVDVLQVDLNAKF